jgi:hypothetical protein
MKLTILYLSFITVDRTGMNTFEMKILSMYDMISDGLTQYRLAYALRSKNSNLKRT